MTTSSVSPQDLLNRLSKAAGSLKPRQAFVVARGARKSPELMRLTPTSALQGDFMKIDAENCKRYGSLAAMEYVPARSIPDGYVMWQKAADVPLIASLGVDDADSQLISTPLSLDSSRTVNLRMTITTSESDDDEPIRATFYRITRNTARLAQSRRFAAIFRDGAFDRLDDEVLLFNHEVDAIATQGHVFFTNRHNFERAFDHVGELREAATRTFEQVCRDLSIDGMDELRSAATGDMNMMAKMASIQRKIDAEPRYAAALTMANLLQFIDRSPGVDVDLDGQGDDRRLVFRSAPAHRYKILKLLDDDFLRSALTSLDYQVDSKSMPLS